MDNTLQQSFAEVYDIIMHFGNTLYNKIPKSFIDFIEQNRDKEYRININYLKDINDQDLLQDTRAILSLIYRDYLCEKDQKYRLQKQDNLLLEKRNKTIVEEYNPKSIFEKIGNEYSTNNNELETDMNDVSLIEKDNKKWYMKFILFIRGFINGKKWWYS